ncbi:NADPH-dependent FMN reductase [Paenibacillus artemisiicola]
MEELVNDMNQRPLIVVGISGSLRSLSANSRILASVEGMLPAGAAFRTYEGVASLPAFNPDLDPDDAEPPEAVAEWRQTLRSADAVVICTPEYARGVPGSLKNALDWVVSSGEFMAMPTAVISVSPHPEGGATALGSLVQTLKMMSATIPDNAILAVPFASRKLGADGSVTDAGTLTSLRGLAGALLQAVT